MKATEKIQVTFETPNGPIAYIFEEPPTKGSKISVVDGSNYFWALIGLDGTVYPSLKEARDAIRQKLAEY